MSTASFTRRGAENGVMAGLTIASRLALSHAKVRDFVALADRLAITVSWAAPRGFEQPDTLARGRALAYRWSNIIPGCSCLHRAVSTQVWLAGFGIRSRVVLGLRKRAALEGHAWLEVDVGGAATLLFVDDEVGYPVEIPAR